MVRPYWSSPFLNFANWSGPIGWPCFFSSTNAFGLEMVRKPGKVMHCPFAIGQVVNASFTYQHPLRHGCYFALRKHADAHPNVTFLAVSFHIQNFMPRQGGRSPPNIKWIVMQHVAARWRHGTKGGALPVPYVVDRHEWPAQTQPTPWEQRKLLFFAGHVSRPGPGIPTRGMCAKPGLRLCRTRRV